MEWLFLLIPIVAAGICKMLYPRQLALWEVGLPVFVGVVAIFIGKSTAEYYTSSDTEYLGGFLVKAIHSEAWDERVTCTHTKYCTDKKGNRKACGKEHSYDVDYHPEYWEIADSNEASWRVSRAVFEGLCAEWKNRVFVEMNRRRVHSIDGDAYRTVWDGQYSSLRPSVREHAYENRVAASHSSLNYREISAEEKTQYALFDYPRSDYYCPSVLGYAHPGNGDLDKTNALIGRAKQVRIWLLCFKDQPLQAAHSQEAYWKRGNKNELVICTSLDGGGKIQWAHVFSWTEQETLKITVRQWLEDRSGQVLDVKAFNDFLKPEVEKSWVRKEFHDFEFLDVELSGAAICMIGLLVIAVTAGTLSYGISNDHYA